MSLGVSASLGFQESAIDCTTLKELFLEVLCRTDKGCKSEVPLFWNPFLESRLSFPFRFLLI